MQALFSEARLADQQTSPSFVGVWNRAQAKTTQPQRAFSLSFVAVTALLVCALVSLAWWASHSQRSREAVIATVSINTTVGPVNVVKPALGQEVKTVTHPGFSNKSRALKLAARREAVSVAAGQKALRDAKAIESWQSPTATLLDSSSDALLKSLPQLNQTVDDLKSFLPNQPK